MAADLNEEFTDQTCTPSPRPDGRERTESAGRHLLAQIMGKGHSLSFPTPSRAGVVGQKIPALHFHHLKTHEKAN